MTTNVPPISDEGLLAYITRNLILNLDPERETPTGQSLWAALGALSVGSKTGTKLDLADIICMASDTGLRTGNKFMSEEERSLREQVAAIQNEKE